MSRYLLHQITFINSQSFQPLFEIMQWTSAVESRMNTPDLFCKSMSIHNRSDVPLGCVGLCLHNIFDKTNQCIFKTVIFSIFTQTPQGYCLHTFFPSYAPT